MMIRFLTLLSGGPKAAALAITAQPTDTDMEGTISTITVEARDENGVLVGTYKEDVVVAIETNPSSGTLSGTTTVAAVAGVATFDDLSIDNYGVGYTLMFTSGTLTEAESDAFEMIGVAGDSLYISPWFYDSVVQGTHEFSLSTAIARQGCYLNNPPADGDGLQFKMYMSAGTYTCRMLAHKDTTRPIVKVKIDGVTVATWDQYGALLYNNIWSQADISVTSSGVKTIQFVVDGKNASATDYQYTLGELVFYRTA